MRAMAEVRMPESKSIAARRVAIACLRGEPPDEAPEGACRDIVAITEGVRGLRLGAGRTDCGDSATALRFLTALAAATEGTDTVLTGSAQLCGRPMGPLVDALRRLGAEIEYMGAEGHAPLRVRGRRLAGGDVEIDGSMSSQFVSALLLASELMERPLNVIIRGEAVSRPYAALTASMLRMPGVASLREGDWSAASCFFQLAALGKTRILLNPLLPPGVSLQGDSRCAAIFGRLGVEWRREGDGILVDGRGFRAPEHIEIKMGDTPDLVPAVAATLAFGGGSALLTGIGHLRAKESDRLEALATELGALGARVRALDSALVIAPGHPARGEREIAPRGDHRMAMAAACCAPALPECIIRVREAECVEKSFPLFWRELRNCIETY